MAKEEAVVLVSLPANADLSASKYLFGVLADSSGNARVAVAGLGADAVGVIYEGASVAGQASAIAISGIAKVTLGATLATSGVRVQSDASGRAIAVASGAVLGFLLTAGVVGDIADVLLAPKGTA